MIFIETLKNADQLSFLFYVELMIFAYSFCSNTMHTCGIALVTTSMHMKCMRYKMNRAH